MELDEVSEYNKNKGKARRRALGKRELRKRQASSRWWGEIRSDGGFEMKLIGGELR